LYQAENDGITAMTNEWPVMLDCVSPTSLFYNVKDIISQLKSLRWKHLQLSVLSHTVTVLTTCMFYFVFKE